MTKKLVLVCALIVFSAFYTNAQPESDDLFDFTKLHEIRINFSEDDFWERLIFNYESVMNTRKDGDIPNSSNEQAIRDYLMNQKSSNSENDINYLEGTIHIDGTKLKSVGVRLKGFSSYWTDGVKKSIKVDFNEFIDSLNYKGIKKINLNNGVGDPSFQRDFISYYLMRAAGVAAPRVSFAKVYLNNVYWGLYTIVEQVDQTFLENNFASGKGNLYKTVGWSQLEYFGADFESYSESVELRTNEDKADGSDYVNLVKSLNELNNKAFNDSIQKLFYLDYFYKVLAIDIISKNWDSYMMHGRNFYLYHEPISDLFYWIPWDYNLAWDGNFNSWEQESGDCSDLYKFTYDTLGNAINYRLQLGKQNLDYISMGLDDMTWKDWWDFSGSDTTLIITDSTVIVEGHHEYIDRGIYRININAGYNNGCYLNKIETVVLFDTADIKCPSIFKMQRQYNPADVLFDEVFKHDHFCCDCQWDILCDEYYNSYPNTTINSMQYPIEFFTDKDMLHKIAQNQDFKEKYFDTFKFILDSVFNADELMQLITQNTDLIRNAVYTDTNLIFSIDEFENDMEAVCNQNYQITSLARLIENRKKGLDDEYKSLKYSAKSLEKELKAHDLVINEFLAARSDDGMVFKSDWIEIYNNTNDVIPLEQVWLSDKKDTLKFNFPGNSVIKPDGFVVVWADDKGKKDGLYSGFKLSGSGEDILLYHEKFDTLDVLTYTYQFEDSSMARFPNGTGPFVRMQPTYNKHNVVGVDVGIADNAGENYLNAYPNPAIGMVWLKTNSYNDFKAELINVLGESVLIVNGQGNSMGIDVSNIPNGLYILNVRHGADSYSSKIVISH